MLASALRWLGVRAALDYTDADGDTPLAAACYAGNISKVRKLLSQGASVHKTGSNTRTPLHFAASRGRRDVVEALLQQKARVDARTIDGWTPLHFAAMNGYMDAVEVLLRHEASVGAKANGGCTPLELAVEFGYQAVAEALVLHQARVQANETKGKAPLHYAASKGHVDVVVGLLQDKASVDVSTTDGWTPLHFAALYGHCEVVFKLLQYKASVDATTVAGCTALHLASENGHRSVVEALLRFNASVDATDKDGRTPLLFAASNRHKRVVSLLLSVASVNAADLDGSTPLHVAASNGDTNVMSWLLRHKASVDATTKNGWTPLHFASQIGRKDVVEVLLRHNASVDATTTDGCTPLHYASRDGRRDVVEALLQHKASFDAAEAEGWTPLHFAALEGHRDVVKAILRRKASVDATARDGRTPLHIASQNGHKDVVAALLLNQASIEKTASDGTTPLHAAARPGATDILRLFVDAALTQLGDTDEHGRQLPSREDAVMKDTDRSTSTISSAKARRSASFDVADDGGNTPVLIAARYGHFDAVRLLLRAGASAHVRFNADGETVLVSAARWANANVVSTLFDMGYLDVASVPVSSEAPLDSHDQHLLLPATLLTLSNYASQTHEFQTMWTRVVDRVTLLHTRMANSPPGEVQRESVFQLVMIVFHLVQLKTICASSSVFARLVASSVAASQFRDLHTELGFLERSVVDVSLSSGSSRAVMQSGDQVTTDWDAECTRDEQALLEQFRVAIDMWTPQESSEGSDAEYDGRDSMGDECSRRATGERGKALEDAAFLLQHFVRVQGETCAVQLRRLLDDSLRKVGDAVSESTMVLPVVPSWFISPYELYAQFSALTGNGTRDATSSATTARTPFATMPTVRVTRGRWSKAMVMASRLERQAFAEMMNICFSLSHPNVVKVFGASHLSSPYVVVLEGAASMNLCEYLKLGEHKHEAWQKLFEVSLGLQYLLERGVVLERLRCEDIWVGLDGVAKICVFKCVGVEDRTQGPDEVLAARHSPDVRWQAPECLDGAPVSSASNVFALAMCALEALTGDVPWGATQSDFIVSVKKRHLWRPEVPSKLQAEQKTLIEQMGDIDPATRPTVMSVSLQLQRFTATAMFNAERDQRGSQNSVASLGSFRFQELGSELGSFLEKLARKAGCCREYPDTVAHIIGRSRDLLEVMYEQHKRADDCAVRRYIEVLLSFDRFLWVAMREQSILERAKSQRVVLDAHVFHRQLDEVLELLASPTPDPVHEWQEENQVRQGVSGGDAESGDAGHEVDSAAVVIAPATAGTTRRPAKNSRPVTIVRFETSALHERFPILRTAANTATTTAEIDPNAPVVPTTASRLTSNHPERRPWFIQLHELNYNPSVDRIGVGSFGEVFKATWRNTPVAVKFMGYEEDDDGAYSCELFSQELCVWFPLNHPHVLKLFGACDVGMRYFVCEIASGGNLLEFVKKTRTNAARGWQLLHQVALGLQYLHEQGVTHNDLKCDNVLVGANGDAKLIDFGLSSIVGLAEVQVDKKFMGAVQWRSPEYLRGEQLTTASDVYSFGMLIVELMLGEPPWGRMTDDFVVRVNLRRGKLLLQPESMSSPQWNLIRMMCAPNPAHRVKMAFVVEKLLQFSQQQQHFDEASVNGVPASKAQGGSSSPDSAP